MSGTWTTDWATNDVVTAAEFRKSMGCVADSTLVGSAASIDFTGIPTTYAHLMIVVYARGDTAASSTNLLARLNNDSAANYDNQFLSSQAAVSTASESLAATALTCGAIPAATAGANLFGQAEILVAHYAGAANNKSTRTVWGMKIGTASTNLNVGDNTGFWRSSAAINRVTLFPAAGNFVAGTRVSIYVMGS